MIIETITYNITIFGVNKDTRTLYEKDITISTAMDIDDILYRLMKQGALGIAIKRKDNQHITLRIHDRSLDLNHEEDSNYNGYLVWFHKLESNLDYRYMWKEHGIYVGYEKEVTSEPYRKLTDRINHCIKMGKI